MKIELRELDVGRWPDLVELFGPSGACGGCWCMFWRTEKGERWEEVKGEPARRRQRKLVGAGKSLGLIAYVDGEPVGWCAFGPRTGFPRLARSRTLACDDADRVWSLPCFFIRRDSRGRGVAGALLRGALKALRKRGAEIAEGYPVNPRGGRYPDAFAWTGTLSLFSRAGFKVVGGPRGGKARVRKTLGR